MRHKTRGGVVLPDDILLHEADNHTSRGRGEQQKKGSKQRKKDDVVRSSSL